MSTSFYDKPPKTNVERVISALEDPNYTWRTSQGVSQATGLPLSEVQKIISELQQDGRVIKSSIPDIRGRPLYKANPTRVLIKQLSETKPDDGSWPTLVNQELLRFEKASLEPHPKRLLQDQPIILPTKV